MAFQDPQEFYNSFANTGTGTNQYPNSPNQNASMVPEEGGGIFDFAGGFSGLGDTLLGGKDTPGILSLGMDLYTGWKQLSNMEEQLGLNRDKFESDQGFQKTNLANQAQAYNTNLADRQRARIGSGGNYESLKSYTDKNKVRGTV